MKRFALITNQSKDPEYKETEHIEDYLEKRGAVCMRAPLTSAENTETGHGYIYDVPEGVDCCIVLGGDGTMLQAAASVFGRDLPLIGVNLGMLGYLAEVEKDGIETALDRLISGDYDIRDRMMIRGVFGLAPGEVHHSLNDIVIARCSSLRVIPFNIYVNGLFLNRYEADGIIISTPTGSTGYNMSAGGPVTEPGSRVILMTPICPHTMGSRTIVLSPEDLVRVELADDRGTGGLYVETTFDGMYHRKLYPGESIDITTSSHVTKIVRLNSESFLETLHRKLK